MKFSGGDVLKVCAHWSVYFQSIRKAAAILTDAPQNTIRRIRSSAANESLMTTSVAEAKGTLLNWEHECCQPTGPAQIFLTILDKRPTLVSELLSIAR
ncbi:hypothetical protein AD940_00115 [Gluconobacter thailandicus]|nr:hypothetical protein AD940_00115 [Gluconobacter thailandicus]